MNILILGGAGYVGSTLTDEILKTNLLSVPEHKVVCYDNLYFRNDCLVPFCADKNFDFVYGDVRDYEKLKPHVTKADVIFPLAALVGAPICAREPHLAQDVNHKAVRWLAENVSKNQMVIFPTTNSGYGVGDNNTYCTEDSLLRPISVYGITKVEAEEALREKTNAIVLRLATCFGVSPRMRMDLLVNDFTYKAVTDGYVVLFEKDFKRNYIHVRDVASAFLFMMNHYNENQGEVFNCGLSDANLSKHELALKIKDYVPGFSIQCDEIGRDPDQRNYVVSNAKIESKGWKPSRSLDYGIQEMIKAYKVISAIPDRYGNISTRESFGLKK